MSWAEILDLSHSVLPRSVVAIFASEVVCLESLGRGGINNGKGEKCAWLSSRSVGAMEIGAEKAEDVCPPLARRVKRSQVLGPQVSERTALASSRCRGRGYRQ